MFSLTTPSSSGRIIGRGCLPAIFALAAAISPPAGIARAQAEETKVVVRIAPAELHPRSPEAARRLLARLERAALEACGGSAFSSFDMKFATTRSQCWRESLARAVDQIGDPLLSQAGSRDLGSGR